MSQTLADEIVDMLFSLEPFELPESLWLGLFTANGEVVGGNYSRVNVTGKFTKSQNGATENAGQIVFPVPSVGWGIITGVGLFDAETGGQMLFSAGVDTSFSAPPNTNIYFNPGVIKFGLTL